MQKRFKLNNGLSEQEVIFCNTYIETGDLKKSSDIAEYNPRLNVSALLNRKHIKGYIEHKMESRSKKIEKEASVSYEWKLLKLKKIVDVFIPENPETLKTDEARVAINSIGEMNRMQGHLSAEKHINVNMSLDPDIQKVLELLPKFEKPY